MLGNFISTQAMILRLAELQDRGCDVGRACLAREGLPYCQMLREREAVQRNVSRIRACEVSRRCRSKSIFISNVRSPRPIQSDQRRSGADTMWLVGMMFGHTLEDGANILDDLTGQEKCCG